MGGLVGLVLLVVLLLPSHVQKPEAPAIDNGQSSDSVQVQQGKQESSPWQEAQLGKQRKAAQDVLEKLLDSQFQLEEIAVAQWAGEDFTRAAALAGKGDEHYRNRQFEEAIAAYEAGLELMEQLLVRKEQALTDVIATGNAAIAAADSAAATKAFQLALAIDPDSPAALQGLKRADVLDAVQELLAKADELEASGNTIEALEVLQQVSGLDPADNSVRQSIGRLQALLDQQEFNRQMSAGYQALGRGSYSTAIAAFQAAIKLDPQATEAQEALRQAKNDRNLYSINGHLRKAEQYIGEEEWQQALQEYDQALAIDDTLVVIRQSREETGVRAQLDAALQDATTRPERLTSEPVWQAAQVLYRKAAAIEKPGPRLSGQLVTLQQQLQDAITPVMVTFSSDNLSQVVLYKVAQLGIFTTHQLELKPGNYTLVASREGYRDVRKEFTVTPRSQSMHMTIQCEEPI
jgi:tetratricopeptide (TPR) repeat protein